MKGVQSSIDGIANEMSLRKCGNTLIGQWNKHKKGISNLLDVISDILFGQEKQSDKVIVICSYTDEMYRIVFPS